MSREAAFFDFDDDNDLDCYVPTNAVEMIGRNQVRKKRIAGEGLSTDYLYVNNDTKINSLPAGICKNETITSEKTIQNQSSVYNSTIALLLNQILFNIFCNIRKNYLKNLYWTLSMIV